jgi:hypothetical protein
LWLRNAKENLAFTDYTGAAGIYVNNAAAVYINLATDITIENCIISG